MISQYDLEHIEPRKRQRVIKALESAARLKAFRENTAVEKAVLQTDTPGLLQPETELERTFKLDQSNILPHLDQATVAKAAFQLDLSDTRLAPYICAKYSRSGRSLLIASRKGHVAVSDWRTATLRGEVCLKETIRDATFLHDDSFFATAQKKYAYIYDSTGTEIHVLRHHLEPGFIQFLPHHLLLVTATMPAAPMDRLVYTDTSTGEVIANLDYGQRTFRLSSATQSCVNYQNGVVHLSHSNGVVSLWSPVFSRPLARIFTHTGGVRNVAVTPDGNYMVTTGADSMLKTWDLRTYKLLNQWRLATQTSALTISQRGLIALSYGSTVELFAHEKAPITDGDIEFKGWQSKPYMRQKYPGSPVTALDFCPFEDLLSVCHDSGMKTMVVPGAGEAMFDSSEPNPYETRKQRSNKEVRALLDKLPPATIMLDVSSVGGVDEDPEERRREVEERREEVKEEKKLKKGEKKKAKGKNKISKRLAKKQNNIIDARQLKLKEEIEKHKKTVEAARAIADKRAADGAAGIAEGGLSQVAIVPEALNRFFPK